MPNRRSDTELRRPRAWISASLLLTAALTFAGETDGGPLGEDYERLRSALDLRAQPWARIPWRVSLDEARAAAAREGKPLFLQINTGNPVGFA